MGWLLMTGTPSMCKYLAFLLVSRDDVIWRMCSIFRQCSSSSSISLSLQTKKKPKCFKNICGEISLLTYLQLTSVYRFIYWQYLFLQLSFVDLVYLQFTTVCGPITNTSAEEF